MHISDLISSPVFIFVSGAICAGLFGKMGEKIFDILAKIPFRSYRSWLWQFIEEYTLSILIPLILNLIPFVVLFPIITYLFGERFGIPKDAWKIAYEFLLWTFPLLVVLMVLYVIAVKFLIWIGEKMKLIIIDCAGKMRK